MSSPNSSRSGSFISLGRGWHTTTFRWLTVYAVVFTISIMSLLAFVEQSVTRAMENEADSGVRWQLRYFDSITDADLASAIDKRVQHEQHRSNYYGLFAADGRRLAGDIVTLPSRLSITQTGESRNDAIGQTVSLAHNPSMPTVRALAERRASGVQLVIGRSVADIIDIKDELIKALVWGGLSCAAASLVTGLLLSIRQIKRVQAIQRVTTQIAQGDIKQRLPINGGDELTLLSHLVNYMLDEVERLMTEVKTACDGIAHDLRTPLAHVRTLLTNIADRASVIGDNQVQDLAKEASLEADSLLGRFRALLRMSEIGALKRREGFRSLSLPTLIFELCELYEPLAEEMSIRLRWNAESMEPIYGDRDLLFEAFSNLLDNSIKFTPAGGDVSVELTSSTLGPRLVVLDNGPGIAENEREAVLQRFYRAEKTRHVPGSGLGLGIVSAVMRMHDFGLNICSANPGAVFVVECWPHSLQ
ncbi:ATP-binding protein [Caballeronia sp. LjRoot31]|uniref:sensor histidine kinase n=1 Tax=Caballeronia sp. LjRoot31 TaxID=3342324 RepID=UPI003ECF59C6